MCEPRRRSAAARGRSTAECLCSLAPGRAGVEGERRDALSEEARSVMRLPQSCRRAGPPSREEAGEPDAEVPILGERTRGDCRYRTRVEVPEPHHRTGPPLREAPTRPMLGLKFQNGSGGYRRHRVGEKTKKGQFKIGKLCGPTATMPEIWRAGLVA